MMIDKMSVSQQELIRKKLEKDSKLLLFICKLKYPRYAPFIFPVYMLLKYIKIKKSGKKFQLRQVPQELIKQLSKSNAYADVNNCVIVDDGYWKAILNEALYVRIKSGGKSRVAQVVSGKVGDEEVLISDTLKFNLKMEIGSLAPVSFESIKIASQIYVSLVSSPHNLNALLTDTLLKNYFKCPKLVYKEDVISIRLQDYAPDHYYSNPKLNEAEWVYFRCNKITFSYGDECPGGEGCLGVVGPTGLIQSADVQSSLPPRLQSIRDRIEGNCTDNLLGLYPEGLSLYFRQLERAAKPFLKDNKLKLRATILLQGGRGSGKKLILTSFAKKLGLQICKLGLNDLTAHAYSQTEIKMRNAFFKAKLCSPTIVVINNFENFCKNNEGQHDSRIISYFVNELNNLFSNNKHPVILVCVSNTKDLPSELSRVFLETITFEAPNQTERSQILEWIVAKKSLKVRANLSEIAGKTHGFLYEDLEALVYYANKNSLFAKTEAIIDKDFEYSMDVMQSNYTQTVGVPKVPKVQWSDIGGLEDVKREIINTINLPLKHSKLLQSTLLKRSGILLYGPPGTGKTLIAKAVATECNLCFLSVKGPELLNMYVGQSEQNVREVFEKARQASPCIVFFDELDSLAPNRGMSGDSGGVMDRVVSQLLSEMDGLNENGTIFVIGATNRPDLIDPALLRPGRFDKLLYVGPCTDNPSKVAVVKALTRKFKLSEKVNLQNIVNTCPDNVTGADFYGICSNAWMTAACRLIKKIEKGSIEKVDELTHDSVVVTLKDFEDAIANVKSSISPADLRYFENLRKELNTKN